MTGGYSPPVIERLQAEGRVFVPAEAEAFLDAFADGETDGMSCWRSAQVERREGSAIEGQGLFAVADIPEGRLVAIKSGKVVDTGTIKDHAETIKGSHQQIASHRFLAGLTPEDVDKNLVGYNHSCDPNARVVLVKDVPLAFLVTRYPIQAGEEITADYSVSQMSDTHIMKVCQCGSEHCRKLVMPAWDWQDEALRAQYPGEIAWFIEEEVERRKNLPPELQQEQARADATYRSAETIHLVQTELNELAARKSEILKGQPRLLQPVLERAYRRSPTGEFEQELRGLLIESAIAFCVACPFMNIEDAGVDRSELLKGEDGADAKLERLRTALLDDPSKLDYILRFARNFNFHLGP